ncbi:MAG: sulfatase-like hydrolase/transferase [Polyangiaceae bacterium]
MSVDLSHSWPSWFRSARRLVAASALAGLCFVLADVWARHDWQQVNLGWHLGASTALYVAWGVGVGVGLLLLELISSQVAKGLRKTRAGNALRLWRWLPVVLLVLLAGWGAHSLVMPLVSHGKAARLARFAWPVGLLLGSSVVLARWLILRVTRSLSPRTPLVFAGLLFAIALLAMCLDLTVLISLYASLHALFEAAALLALIGSAWCLLTALERDARRVGQALNVIAGVATLSLLAFPFWRTRLFDELRPAWREPVYVGRLMARVQTVEEDLLGEESADPPGVKRLKRTYDLTVTTEKPEWSSPPALPKATEAALAELRPDPEKLNVLVYYVDTLRADIASDPHVMPNFAQFCEESLCFERAYSAASDTVSTLPVVIGGRFDGPNKHAPTVLGQAEHAGRETTLIIPRSAGEFLGRELPTFKFNRMETVADYNPGEQVWGYGATQPTAGKLVDRAIATLFDGEGKAPLPSADRALGAPRVQDLRRPGLPSVPNLNREALDRAEQPFFGWVFNFDVHNWRELDEAYVNERAATLGVGDKEDPIWRYRVVAHAVDEEFGRLMRELDKRGLKDNTLVVIMADHGEALGRHGFWVHSTFLWEGLVHVPLAIRIPGVTPKKVSRPISLADLAPTLVRSLEPTRSLAGYHGEDLLVHALPQPPARRLPILMEAWYKTDRLRIGVIDPDRRLKLVVPLESGVPEVHRLDDADPEATDVSQEESAALLGMLDHLVGSPLFPRPAPPSKPTVATR